jgi:hypothetical protein
LKLKKEFTVNDVITALFGGMCRKYLEKTNDPSLKSKDLLIRGQVRSILQFEYKIVYY